MSFLGLIFVHSHTDAYSHGSRSGHLSDDWFRMFDNKFDLERLGRSRNTQIHIAVLDTGINSDNEWISAQEHKIQYWPNKSQCQDTDGHGTHVAYLILRIAKYAKLHIAKISALNDVDNINITELVKVLKQMVCRIRIRPLTSPRLSNTSPRKTFLVEMSTQSISPSGFQVSIPS